MIAYATYVVLLYNYVILITLFSTFSPFSLTLPFQVQLHPPSSSQVQVLNFSLSLHPLFYGMKIIMDLDESGNMV